MKMHLFSKDVTLNEAIAELGYIKEVSRVLINWSAGETLWEVE